MKLIKNSSRLVCTVSGNTKNQNSYVNIVNKNTELNNPIIVDLIKAKFRFISKPRIESGDLGLNITLEDNYVYLTSLHI